MNYASIRERIEAREEGLSVYAAKSRLSRGRARPEDPCSLRGPWSVDRDRIIHCLSFRRLKRKTQVFIAPVGDHFVTRLAHTLETTQIARTIARALNLNEDLTEAIALGHDLGHTPFGHVGEEVIGRLYAEGFRHNEQSLRVVDVLERDGRGLNLTYEVREGILKHSKPRAGVFAEGWGTASTLEGQVVKLSDAVAYLNHDVQDAIRAGLLREEQLPEIVQARLGRSHGARIDSMVRDVVESSWAATGEGSLAAGAAPTIAMSPPVREATDALREFMFQRVYAAESPGALSERAGEVVEGLYRYFVAHPEELPAEFFVRGDPVERAAVDYVAGMTDNYALATAARLGLPGVEAFTDWRVARGRR